MRSHIAAGMGRYPAGVERKARGHFHAGSTVEEMVTSAVARVGYIVDGGAGTVLLQTLKPPCVRAVAGFDSRCAEMGFYSPVAPNPAGRFAQGSSLMREIYNPASGLRAPRLSAMVDALTHRGSGGEVPRRGSRGHSERTGPACRCVPVLRL